MVVRMTGRTAFPPGGASGVGGSSDVIFTAIIPMSTEDILAASTGFELLPAPGPNKMIVVTFLSMVSFFGTTPFQSDSSGQPGMWYGDPSNFAVAWNFEGGDGNIFGQSNDWSMQGASATNVTSPDLMINQPVLYYSSVLTEGDGTARIAICYFILDVTPP